MEKGITRDCKAKIVRCNNLFGNNQEYLGEYLIILMITVAYRYQAIMPKYA